MNFSSILNERQYQAVSTESQYVRIVAGAGSGKTRVLTFRIAHLIVNKGVKADRILAIAFTNKVANEMKTRAVSLIEDIDPGHTNLNIKTFHAFCAMLLRMEAKVIGYPQNFVIYDEDDQSRMVRACAEAKGYRKSDPVVKDALAYIRRRKGQGLYPEDISRHNLKGTNERTLLDLYDDYEKRKTACFAFDFDDLLLMAIKLLSEHEEVRDYWSHRYKHILIDEFQDTNDVQMKLVELISNPSTCIYVVGDPDQTIYTWRGANQKIIMGFETKYKGTETIVLDRNYRSTKTILNAANKLISNNKQRIPKDLYTEKDGGYPIETMCAYSLDGEAKWVAGKVMALAESQRGPDGEPNFRNIALLYRSNYMSRQFELIFGQQGIPYQVFGGHRFYERLEVKDILAYCSLMENHFDNVAFERIANAPRRGIGESSLAKLREEAYQAGLSEFQYVEHLMQDSSFSSLKSKVITPLTVMVEKIKKAKEKLDAKDETYASIIQEFVTSIGYLDYIAEKEEEDEDRVGNCKALFDDILSFQKNNPNADFSEYLQNVTLLTSQDEMADGNYVSFMTVHTAKGLEYDNVFVVYMTDEAFPNQKALSESHRDGEEEERRLAYVAVTRAKERLFLSTNLGYSYATGNNATPSRYFREMGIKLNNEYPFVRKSFAKTLASSRPLFDDGDHIDPFGDSAPKEAPLSDTTVDNGISWKVGDGVEHDTFGKGQVVEMPDRDTLIVVFETAGRKIMLASHPKLHKTHSKGGLA